MVIHKGRRGGVRSKLVEPYFQIKLGVIFVFVNIVFAILISSVTWWILYDVFAAMKTYFELSGGDAALTLEKFNAPLTVIAIIVFMFIATTLYVAIHYTHKIYGPLVSIHRFVDEMIEGRRPSKLILRDGDQLQDLVLKLNILADKESKK